jgi:flagellar biogenesis protein FliO
METIQQVLAVTMVLGLLGGTLWWLRRRGLATIAGLPARRKAGGLQRLERLPLTATHTLHLVKVGEREVLIACSPAGCQVIEGALMEQGR